MGIFRSWRYFRRTPQYKKRTFKQSAKSRMMPHPEELEGFRVKKKESVEILTPGAMKAFFGALDREWLSPFRDFGLYPRSYTKETGEH